MTWTRLVRSAAPTIRIRSTPGRFFHATPARSVVTEIQSAAEFQRAVSENTKVVVDCSATWCGPCQKIAPFLESQSEEPTFKNKIHFVKFDVDDLPDVAEKLDVRAMPTFVFFENGKKVDQLVGADPSALVRALKKLLP